MESLGAIGIAIQNTVAIHIDAHKVFRRSVEHAVNVVIDRLNKDHGTVRRGNVTHPRAAVIRSDGRNPRTSCRRSAMFEPCPIDADAVGNNVARSIGNFQRPDSDAREVSGAGGNDRRRSVVRQVSVAVSIKVNFCQRVVAPSEFVHGELDFKR